MPTWAWILIAVAVVVVIAAVVWLAYDRKRSRELQRRFGPEYDRTVAAGDGRREAEADLRAREERVDHLDIRPLSTAARRDFYDRWQRVQAYFVNDPRDAFQQADGLVSEVMRERGYPMDDFDQRAKDVSVDHPDVVEHYREAHSIAVTAPGNGTDTEQLRRGMMHYRDLFTELLRPEARSEAG
jgi:hypothetical protein